MFWPNWNVKGLWSKFFIHLISAWLSSVQAVFLPPLCCFVLIALCLPYCEVSATVRLQWEWGDGAPHWGKGSSDSWVPPCSSAHHLTTSRVFSNSHSHPHCLGHRRYQGVCMCEYLMGPLLYPNKATSYLSLDSWLLQESGTCHFWGWSISGVTPTSGQQSSIVQSLSCCFQIWYIESDTVSSSKFLILFGLLRVLWLFSSIVLNWIIYIHFLFYPGIWGCKWDISMRAWFIIGIRNL